MNVTIDITGMVQNAINSVASELPARAFAASQKLRNASLEVLRGQRSGRQYRAPSGGMYTASAPGESPAVRTGTLRGSWRTVQYGSNSQNPAIETNVPYADYMENGTPGGKIAPRPFAQKIIDKARPEIEAIYTQPYNINP